MKIDDALFSRRILDLVSGELDVETYPVPEADLVRNEFEEGSACAVAYEKMLEAYMRICRKTGSDRGEDEDVEAVIENLRFIRKHLALKMFDYGVFFARRELGQ